jgi:MFS transporter, ACS family, D-galactonate transporter
MCQNAAAINSVIKVAGPLQKIAPYALPLTALSKIPASDLAYLKAHGTDVQNAANKTDGQWKTWYWICFGGIIFFILSIPILRGRWKTADAKRDEEEHEKMVEAELASLNA